MVLCERWVSSMFFYSPARKWESKGDLFPHPIPHFFWFILQLQKSLSLGGCRCPRSFQHSIQAFQWIEVDLKEAEVEESSCRWIEVDLKEAGVEESSCRWIAYHYFYWFQNESSERPLNQLCADSAGFEVRSVFSVVVRCSGFFFFFLSFRMYIKCLE